MKDDHLESDTDEVQTRLPANPPDTFRLFAPEAGTYIIGPKGREVVVKVKAGEELVIRRQKDEADSP